MAVYFKEIGWNDDFVYLKEFALTLLKSDILQDIDFGKLLEDINHVVKDKRILKIKQKYDLHNHFYFLLSTPTKLVHDPHVHTDEDTFISLNIPIRECDENTITSWLEPIGEIRLAHDKRTSNVLDPCMKYKILETNSLTVPTFVRNDIFHKVESNKNVTQRINLAWPLISKYKSFSDIAIMQ